MNRMNRIPIFTILILTACLLAAVAIGAEYAPKSFSLYNVTKSKKVSVKGTRVITVNPSKATSVYLNGKGDDWLIAAGAERDLYVFTNISSMTFTNATTAAADPNKLRVMTH
ncbi:MAG: hypothetical protein A2Y38_12365 [Spirochaetes bacterium GWB1_59_5]|nr:MAG: hypothetical protein A2Y38_12365 [Spirochaetes bacterium GWB1_59_5]